MMIQSFDLVINFLIFQVITHAGKVLLLAAKLSGCFMCMPD
jgi:hypothetical protein